jgi:hypothetical protein
MKFFLFPACHRERPMSISGGQGGKFVEEERGTHERATNLDVKIVVNSI